jgi:hypothetical protein
MTTAPDQVIHPRLQAVTEVSDLRPFVNGPKPSFLRILSGTGRNTGEKTKSSRSEKTEGIRAKILHGWP